MNGPAGEALRAAQDRLFQLLGNSVDRRHDLVGSMLRRDAREATSYWLQLSVSVGIATLGLVVGSAAVVIGAMLVAPLMGPIVGLAMGLATGSPFLVLRSATRIAASVAVAVAGATAITLALPFHQVNPEITARTSPTALDLVTAAFCAIAGVYASLRPGSDTSTTAAGTSISISLVPPLCAAGFGVGTSSGDVAAGAGLLFLTNLVAIVVVGTVAFVAAGFNRVDVVALERGEMQSHAGEAWLGRALASRLAAVFDSRWGPLLRVFMPFVLLAAVYVPLRRALDEVAWRIRVETAVRQAIARERLRVVQTRVRIDPREVDVALVVLGTAAEASQASARLDAEIGSVAGFPPRVEVLAVADAHAVAGLRSSIMTPRLEAPPSPRPAPPGEEIDRAGASLRGIVDEIWPSSTAGDVLGVDVTWSGVGPLHLRVIHWGAPVALDALVVMERVMAARTGRSVTVDDVAVPREVIAPDARDGGETAFVARVASLAQATSAVVGMNLCVSRPDPKTGRPGDTRLAETLLDSLGRGVRARVEVGPSTSIQFVVGSCPSSAPTGDGRSGGGGASR